MTISPPTTVTISPAKQHGSPTNTPTTASDTTNAVASFITLRGFKGNFGEKDGHRQDAIEFTIPTTDFPQKVIRKYVSVSEDGSKDGKSSFFGIKVGRYLLIAMDFDSLGTNTLVEDISTLSTVLTHVRDRKEHDRINAYLEELKKISTCKEKVAAYERTAEKVSEDHESPGDEDEDDSVQFCTGCYP